MRSLFSAACLLAVLVAAPAKAVDWRPIDPAVLALDTPKIDPDADAEAIFWDIWIADQAQGSMLQTIRTHYLRIKIFTERGVEDHSTIDLSNVVSTMRILNLKGRTIKPDGSIVKLEKANIFERDVVKTGDIKMRKRSFSMPNVEVGDIIEYQWREFYDDSLANNLRLYLQREIPTWVVTYHLKPSALAVDHGYTMHSQSFNVNHSGFKKEPTGFWTTSAENMPAFKKEPYMPPDDQVQSWVLLLYTKDRNADQDKFWKDLGKSFFDAYQKELKPSGAVKKAAAEIVSGAVSAEEKIEKIRAYCLNQVRSVYHDRSGMSAEERSKFKSNQDPSDTLAKGMGTSYDISMLFGSLAQAAGLDARVARLPRRDDRFFNPGYLARIFLNSYVIAVDVDGEWRFYDPASPYLPEGMLVWAEEGVPALLTDRKDPEWLQTPYSGVEDTLAKRVAKMELLPDGTLEGVVTQTYTGHFGALRKRIYDGRTEQERVDRIEALLEARLSTAELSDIQVENADSVTGDFSYSYKIRIPGYAARTGKRIFLEPNFFEKNRSPRFKTSERRHDVYFSFGWTEVDQVSIEIPEGFTLEDAESPQSTHVQDVGSYEVGLAVSDDRTLIYDRKFVWGLGGNILFPVDAYAGVKRVFDFVHAQDGHLVTLRASEAPSTEDR